MITISNLKHEIKLRAIRWPSVFLLVTAIFYSCRASNNNLGYQSITEKANHNGQPVWSLDGKKIIYRPALDEPMVIRDLERGSEDQLSLPIVKRGYGNITWISGSEIAYTPTPSSPDGALVIFDLSSNTEKVLNASVEIFDLCWNPVGEAFILVTEQPTSSSTSTHGNTVMKYDPNSAELSPLYRARDGHVVTDIACRRNDDRIAIIDRTGDTTSGYTTELKVITTSFLSEQTILESSSKMRIDEPTWSPTGEWLAVRSIEGNLRHPDRGILLVASDGSETRHVDIPWSKGALTEMEWSPVDNLLLVRLRDGITDYSLNLFDLTPWID